MVTEFKIHLEDDEPLISNFVSNENKKYVDLYEWQRKGMLFFEKHNHSLFECATGSGKTFFAIEIIKKILEKEKNNNKFKILIVVPKNILISQVWHQEFYKNGISLKYIGVWYGRIKEKAKITITNMQNIKTVGIEDFDFVVFDEVHNYCTKRLFTFLKHECKYKLGLSATMKRMDSKHWELYRIFDYNIFHYTPKQALRDEVLNPFNFTNVGVVMEKEDMEKYLSMTEELNMIFASGGGFNRIMRSTSALKSKMLSLMNKRKQLVNNYPKKFEIAKQICFKHKNDKIIIFNQFNEQTSKMYWYLLEIGIKACIVHSHIPHKKREENLRDFKLDKYNVMLASKVLDEGYNLPKIDTAIIMAGDSTTKQTIQRMGRVLRKKDKNSNLYQVYCLNTIEETYGNERAKFFKELCSKYDEIIYDEG